MLAINNKISIPLREFDFSYSRSPGPGGQNVNKVNTKVTLRWNVQNSPSISDHWKDRIVSSLKRRINKQGELIIHSHRFRDQGRNVADALAKLRELIHAATITKKVRKKTKPSKASKRRRLENKRRTSDKKNSRKDLTRRKD